MNGRSYGGWENLGPWKQRPNFYKPKDKIDVIDYTTPLESRDSRVEAARQVCLLFGVCSICGADLVEEEHDELCEHA